MMNPSPSLYLQQPGIVNLYDQQQRSQSSDVLMSDLSFNHSAKQANNSSNTTTQPDSELVQSLFPDIQPSDHDQEYNDKPKPKRGRPRLERSLQSQTEVCFHLYYFYTELY